MEKAFHIEAIDPIELFGIKNTKLDIIKKAFPNIKLIVRGNDITIIGDELYTCNFENKLKQLISFFNKYNRLSNEDIIQILNSDNNIEKNDIDNFILYGNHGKPIKALTKNQEQMVQCCEKHDLVFALGPAGSGKTYTAIALAVRALKNKEVKKIILSRPAVEAGERLGFLPGDLKDKIDPYLQPLYDALNDMIPLKKLEHYLTEGIIQIAPLAFMRGRTLNDAFVILDEAQNTTNPQMKMFLTRMGINAKFIITGDTTQIDLPKTNDSGLIKSLEILKNIKGICFVKLNATDIVRHKLVKKIVKAYDNK